MAATAVDYVLRWNARPTADTIARQIGVDAAAVRGRLARLAAAGLIGYDLAEGAYFYRATPIRNEDPPLRCRDSSARELVDTGRVRFDTAEGATSAVVKGRDGDYLVSIRGDLTSCTCTWFAKHGGDRGPCSHVLAAQMTPIQ